MKESYESGSATHIGPESCGAAREGGVEALTGECAGRALSRVSRLLRDADAVPIPEQGKWLRAVVGGHFRYYGVPMNQPALTIFRFRVGWLWHRSLSRRSQNGRVRWDRMRRLITRWLPLPSVCHPYPLRRMGVIT